MTGKNNDQQDGIYVSRAELHTIFAKAAEEAIHKEAIRIGQALACDLQDALRAINDELGRFADRIKSLEEWTANHAADADTRRELQQPKVDQIRSETAPIKVAASLPEERMDERVRRKRNDTNLNKETDIVHTKVDTASRADQTNEDVQLQDAEKELLVNDTEGWTRVERKKKKNNVREYGAVLIGGPNVSRIKAAAMDEFSFDQNVSFVTAASDELNQSLCKATQRSKAKKIEVVIHSGSEDAVEHSADYVLEKLANMVKYASHLRKVEKVLVCSLEERRDAGSTVHENIKTINTELAQLCQSTGSTFIDLRPRLKESLFGGINRTGILYTFEGARNAAQHLLGETPGFLD